MVNLNINPIIIIIVQLIITIVIVKCDYVQEFLESQGYPSEKYPIVTSDGYMLTLHRIPPKRTTTTPTTNQTQSQGVFLLMHGIIGSSADFLLPGRNKGLGCILHDSGYDVWLGNSRGNTWSKNHVRMNTTSKEFWNFSWHEMGVFDLPAIVDTIINRTGVEQINYVAHSQGTTIFFVMLSEFPEYNKKIASAHMLAPIAFLGHLESPLARIAAQQSNELQVLVNTLGLYELFPSTVMNKLGGPLLCGPTSPTQDLCLLITYLTVGFSEYNMDRNFFPKIFETTPAGISTKQLLHFAQLYSSGKFQKFDYSYPKENYKRYQRRFPPSYNLNNIQVPLNLYSGTRDFLANKKDVHILMTKLVNTRYTLKEIPGFNHIDLLYSTEAPQIVYREILAKMKKLQKSLKG